MADAGGASLGVLGVAARAGPVSAIRGAWALQLEVSMHTCKRHTNKKLAREKEMKGKRNSMTVCSAYIGATKEIANKKWGRFSWRLIKRGSTSNI